MDASMFGMVRPAAPTPASMSGDAPASTAVAAAGRSVRGKASSDPVLLLVGLVGAAIAFGYISVSGALRVGKK